MKSFINLVLKIVKSHITCSTSTTRNLKQQPSRRRYRSSCLCHCRQQTRRRLPPGGPSGRHQTRSPQDTRGTIHYMSVCLTQAQKRDKRRTARSSASMPSWLRGRMKKNVTRALKTARPIKGWHQYPSRRHRIRNITYHYQPRRGQCCHSCWMNHQSP